MLFLLIGHSSRTLLLGKETLLYPFILHVFEFDMAYGGQERIGLKTAHGVVCVGNAARNQIKRRSIRRVGNFSSIAKKWGLYISLDTK